MRKALAVLFAAALMAVSMGDAASAHSKKFDRTITAVTNGAARIDATVSSSKEACRVGVRVDIIDEDGNGELVFTDYTNADGVARFELLSTGVYKTVARKKVIQRTSGHKHVCPEVISDPGLLIA